MTVLRNPAAARLRLAAEAEAMADLLSRAAVPEAASPEIVAAPAAGPRLVAPQSETVQTANGPRVRRATFDGHHPVRRATALDRAAAQAARRGRDAPLFTPAQINAAETYAGLVEWLAAQGVKCSSIEAVVQASMGGGTRIDRIVAVSRRLRGMWAAMGDAVVLSPARAGHADRPRGTIRVRGLVDRVCVGGLTVTEVLRAAGWSARSDQVSAAHTALCDALDSIRDL